MTSMTLKEQLAGVKFRCMFCGRYLCIEVSKDSGDVLVCTCQRCLMVARADAQAEMREAMLKGQL